MQFKLLKLLLGTTTLLFSTFFSQSASAQLYTWSQTDNNPKPMINSNEGVCFLTSIQGKFEGDKERVEVYRQNGQWFLGGNSTQFGVSGQANCVRWNQLLVNPYTVYGPYSLHQNQGKFRYLDGFSEGNGFCFLGGVSGKFHGSGEGVEVVLNSNREWILKVDSNQWGVSASAYCIPTIYNYSNLRSQVTWTQNAPTFYLGSNYASCFLTGMRGKFQGAGERVTVSNNFGEWYLGGASNQFGVAASARCYR